MSDLECTTHGMCFDCCAKSKDSYCISTLHISMINVCCRSQDIFLVLDGTRRENTTPGGRHEITRRQSYRHFEMTD